MGAKKFFVKFLENAVKTGGRKDYINERWLSKRSFTNLLFLFYTEAEYEYEMRYG